VNLGKFKFPTKHFIKRGNTTLCDQRRSLQPKFAFFIRSRYPENEHWATGVFVIMDDYMLRPNDWMCSVSSDFPVHNETDW
jgi:hypothetical protein